MESTTASDSLRKSNRREIKRSRKKPINTVGVGIHEKDIIALFKGDKSVMLEAINGSKYNPLRELKIHPKTQAIIDDFLKRNAADITPENPMASKTKWKDITNCVEYDLVNKGFNKYATNASDMYVYVTDKNGIFKIPCDNCMDLYNGLNYFDGNQFKIIGINNN